MFLIWPVIIKTFDGVTFVLNYETKTLMKLDKISHAARKTDVQNLTCILQRVVAQAGKLGSAVDLLVSAQHEHLIPELDRSQRDESDTKLSQTS